MIGTFAILVRPRLRRHVEVRGALCVARAQSAPCAAHSLRDFDPDDAASLIAFARKAR
jgi:hypothetical protein